MLLSNSHSLEIDGALHRYREQADKHLRRERGGMKEIDERD